ncbi:isocitrate/isopropylmalate family dehydrogenase [Bartonella sp. B17]
MNKKVLVLAGDGIGPEICREAIKLFEIFNLPIQLDYSAIGWECWCQDANPVPTETWQKITEADAILLGAITSKDKPEALKALPFAYKNQNVAYVSPLIQLRQKLDLFANIYPIFSIVGEGHPFRCCIIRENSEGLYAGLDFKGIKKSEVSKRLQHPNIDKSGRDEVAWTARIQTRFGLERLFKLAFEYASTHHFKRVTFADKLNVMQESSHFAGTIFFEVAAQFPNIHADIHNVDALALCLIRKPHEFGVIVAENMFGDVLSNVGAAVMGGLWLAPSANIGGKSAYFKPVHGSAPHIAGQDKANPTAMFYTVAMLLDYLGFEKEAGQIHKAIKQVMKEAQILTYDLGGNASTTKMAHAIIEAIKKPKEYLSASVITIGDELLSGQYLNTNQQMISQWLKKFGYVTRSQSTCGDNLMHINHTILASCRQDDLIVVCGGLGPTPDDKTREAVSKTVGQALIYNETAWLTIQDQLQKLGLPLDDCNKLQAFFPENAQILDNPWGTAPGFYLSFEQAKILVLPGPPSQAQLMLENYLRQFAYLQEQKKTYHWVLIGISEGEIGRKVQKMNLAEEHNVHFLWKSPYVFVEIETAHDASLSTEALAKFEQEFSGYIVSRDKKTALDILTAHYNVIWETKDNALQSCLPTTIPDKRNLPRCNVSVQIEPAFQTLITSTEVMGKMTISVHHSKTKQHHLTVPYNQLLLKQVVPHYAAWCFLESLKEG